ncbi:DUF6629 family protein [Arenibacterium sp. CAU 1754]
MCFSAEASFAASAILVPVGIYTLNTARTANTAYLAFASFPLFFGIQQAVEGWLWLTIPSQTPTATYLPAIGFLFFAYFLWPFLVPYATWRVEPDRMRRRVFAGFCLLGVFLGLSLFVPLLQGPKVLQVGLVKQSILYDPTLIWDGVVSRTVLRVVYAIAICVPMMLSSDRQVQIFGVLITLSVIGGFWFAAYAFTSIWCFFAALLSLYILVVVRRLEPAAARVTN